VFDWLNRIIHTPLSPLNNGTQLLKKVAQALEDREPADHHSATLTRDLEKTLNDRHWRSIHDLSSEKGNQMTLGPA